MTAVRDRKCSTVRMVRKAPEPPPETNDETLLELARRRLGLPPHASRAEILRALNAHFVT